MKTRELGKTKIKVSEIGFGSHALGGIKWGPQKDSDSIAALHKAIDLGCTFFDTALVYGDGNSEKLIGTVLKERNCVDDVIVATKVPPENGFTYPKQIGTIKDAFPKDWISECLEKSLKNLGRNYVDILQLHAWDESWNNDSDWIDVMQTLKDVGKIRAFGISVMVRQPDQANSLVSASNVDTIQVGYNILEQSPEDKLFPLAKNKKVGIIARIPLASGLLAGKWSADTTFSENDFRRKKYGTEKLLTALKQVELVKEVIGDSMPLYEAAIKFCLANKVVSSVIPGARNAEQAKLNFNIADNAKSLSKTQLSNLKKLWKEKKIGNL